MDAGMPVSVKIISHSFPVDMFCSFSATSSDVNPIFSAVLSMICLL